MAREEIGLQPCSKVILRHAQQDLDTISSEVFLSFFRQRKNLCYQGIERGANSANIMSSRLVRSRFHFFVVTFYF